MRCHECGKTADWVDRNFDPPRPFCSEHVVQDARVHTMNVYDWLEEAGHDIVLIAGLQAGVSTYYCDRCGAIVLIADHGIKLFHVAHGNGTSREDQCYPGRPRDVKQGDGEDEPLRDKLKRLHDEDMERLRAAMED